MAVTRQKNVSKKEYSRDTFWVSGMAGFLLGVVLITQPPAVAAEEALPPVVAVAECLAVETAFASNDPAHLNDLVLVQPQWRAVQSFRLAWHELRASCGSGPAYPRSSPPRALRVAGSIRSFHAPY